MNLHPITPEQLAAQALCKTRDARRLLERKHGAGAGGVWMLTVEQYGAAYDFLRRHGAVYGNRAGNSAGAAQMLKSNAQTKSRRER